MNVTMTAKSIFLGTYMPALALAVGHALWRLAGDPGDLAWWGVLVGCSPGALFFARVFLAPVARTRAVMRPVFVMHALGTLLLLASGSGEPLPWGYVLVVGWADSLLYQLWYSRFGRKGSAALAPGRTLPDLVLEDAGGREVRVQDLPGALLMIFYRGNWCPLCVAQIREVAGQYRELAARGVQTVLVSSQPAGHTAELAAKFDAPMHFLVDRDNRAARSLGILARNGTPPGLQALGYESDTAMPTVVLTDAARKILFCDETDNYRVRPEPETFLRILDAA